jgi:hypothetical protein
MGIAYIATVPAQYRHTEGVVWYFGLGLFSLLAAKFYYSRKYREAMFATVLAYSIPVAIHIMQGF